MAAKANSTLLAKANQKNDWFDADVHQDLLQRSFIAGNASSLNFSGRLEKKVSGYLYAWRRSRAHLASQRFMEKQYAEISQIQKQARADGGLNGSFQFARLWELAQWLKELQPKNALEMGCGASSAMFAQHFRDRTLFTTVEENEFWLRKAQKTWGPLADWIESRLASRKVIDLDGEMVCHYDMPHDRLFDLVYVDGPSNVRPDNGLCADGSPHMACVDVELFWKNGCWPRFILVDGRRSTVRRLISQSAKRYRVLLKTDYLPKDHLGNSLTFRYHTLLVLQ